MPLGIGSLRILTMTQVGADSVQIVMATGDMVKTLRGIADSAMSDGDKLKAYALAIGQYGVMAGLTYAGVRGNLHELGTALAKPGAQLIQAGNDVLVPGRAQAADYIAELEKHVDPEVLKNLAPEKVRIVEPKEAGSGLGLSRIDFVNGKPQVVIVDGVHPSVMREEAIHLEQLALAERSAADVKKMAAGNPALEAELLRTRRAAIDLQEISGRWGKASPLDRVRAHEARLDLEIDGQQRLIAKLKADIEAGKPVDRVQVENAFQNLDNLQINRAEMVGVRDHVAKAGGKPGEIDPQLDLPPALFGKKTVPSSSIPPAWFSLSREDFIRVYKSRYPVSSLDDADLAMRYDLNKRLDPSTGRLVDITQDRIEHEAKFKPGEETLELTGPNKISVGAADQAKINSLQAERDAARNLRDAAKAKIPPDMAAANLQLNKMIVASRRMGEHAASMWVRRTYPGPPEPQLIYPRLGAPSRSGDFDQIWKATKNGKKVWLVVEAKGGSSDLQGRTLKTGPSAGTRAEQGNPLYFDDIIWSMQKSGGSVQSAADSLEAAMVAKREIRYVVVSAPIDSTVAPGGTGLSSALNEIKIRDFDMGSSAAAAPVTTPTP